MKKRKLSTKTLALLAAALLLMIGGTLSGTMAVLNIYSPDHFLQFKTDDQDVVIQENGEATDKLLSSLNDKIMPGTANTEAIRAYNSSDSDQFVRIVVRKYWVDEDGYKMYKEPADEDAFFPDITKIRLGLADNGLWIENPKETTAERTVYYYKDVVKPGNATADLTSTLTLDKTVADAVDVSDPDENNGVITYTYYYDGYTVCLEAEAQSIQTHNAAEAVKSIWGVQNVEVNAAETGLSVN